MGAENTGTRAPGVCTRETARLVEKMPRPQGQTLQAGGQQKLKPCELRWRESHSYQALGTGRASNGPRGPGVEKDRVWEPVSGAMAGWGRGCSRDP